MDNSVLDRLELIRKNQDLKKADFEKIIGKSSGYISILKNKGGIPGADVLIKIAQQFPLYNLQWLLTGEGEMLNKKAEVAAEPVPEYKKEKEILEELAAMKSEMQENFEAVNGALVQLLKGDNKLQRFVEGLTAAELQETAKLLQEYLKDKQEK